MMNLQDQITEELIDITEFETVQDLISYYEPDHIVHLAAQAIAGKGYENPILTYRTNLMGTVNLLEGVRLSHTNPSITTMSTNKVFGNTSKAAIDDKYLPTGP